jgi:FkbM family methyltransferase
MGECNVPLFFRPSEYPSLLKGVKYFEQDLKHCWRYLLREGDTIFDIGANIGITVQRFCFLLDGRCNIIAFEPSPRNLQLLNKNIIGLKIDSINVVECAVGNFEGSTIISDNIEHGGLTRLADLDSSKPKDNKFWRKFTKIETEIITVDNYLNKYQGHIPSFIKIDVEGAGGWVIEGAAKTLSEQHPVLSCSFHSQAEKDSIVETIRVLGYRGVHVDSKGVCYWRELEESGGHYVHPSDSRAVNFRE